MIGRVINQAIGLLIFLAFVLAVVVFALWWGEELWYGRYPVEDGYAAFWAAEHGRAHPILRAYARRGDPRAQTYVALQYQDGKGTFRSERLAARWMQRAAEQNYPDALVLMAGYYREGVGVQGGRRRAREYYRRAAELGHPHGVAGLAFLDLYGGNEPKGLRLLGEALAQGGIWARDIQCRRQIRWPQDDRLPGSSPETLRFCMEAGLGGYKGALSRALIMLYSQESPHRDHEKAYELVIIGLSWWPEEWEDPNGLVTGYARGSVLVAPPRSPINSTDEPWRDFETPIFRSYWAAVDSLHDRIRAIGADPTVDLDPPVFKPGLETRLDQAAMLRAEAAARAYLIENPRRPSWIQ